MVSRISQYAKRMRKIQEYLFYLYVFSLNFGQWDPLNLGIDFLITKTTAVLFLLSTIPHIFSNYRLKGQLKYLLPILIFTVYLIVINYLNRNVYYDRVVNVPFLFNVIIMWASLNMAKNNAKLFQKALLFFAISCSIITAMYFFNIEVENNLGDERVTVLKDNQNYLGIKLSIAILTIYMFIKGKILNLDKKKIVLIIVIASMCILLVNTGSRVAILSLVVGLFSSVILKKRKYLAYTIVSIVLFSVGITLLWQYVIKDTYLGERLLMSFYQADLSERDVIWQATIKAIQQGNWMFGMGQTGFPNAITVIFGSVASPHNVFIEIMAYTGIVGSLFFFWFIIKVFASAISNYRYLNDNTGIVFLVPIVGNMISAQLLGNIIFFVIFCYIVSKKQASQIQNKQFAQ
jgi:O-antigen ligase